MDVHRSSTLRRIIVAALMVAFTLAGVGRGFATAFASSDAIPFIPGVTLHICHAGDRDHSPDDRGQHDCCDQCALCAPVVFPGSPDVPVISPLAHDIVRSAIVVWTVRLSRTRSPRQAQGPPAA